MEYTVGGSVVVQGSLNTLYWRLPILPFRVPSALRCLTRALIHECSACFCVQPQHQNLSALCWRLPTLAFRLPSAQEGLTSVFGMRTGVAPPTKHQHKELKIISVGLGAG